MNRLVAIDLPGGAGFVDALRRVWDDGDAALPVDQRLPTAARSELVGRLGAAAVADRHGITSVDGGWPIEPGDALVVATSGATGTPKGVVLTHDAVVASAAATSRRLSVDPATDHWLACLPLSHVGGLSVVTRAILTDTPLTVHSTFDADAVDASDATLVSLVATAMRRIDTERWRVIVLGGAHAPDDRPPNSVTTYGMTESGSGVVYDGVPLDDVEVRVVDGELHLRCPMLLRCYRDGTDPRTPDGWFPTGDLGDIERWRVIVLGGAHAPDDRPPNSVTTYGMTESGSGVVYDGVPLDDVEVRVVDGELHLRCPMLLRCYRDGTDPRTPDGWFPTGDLGGIDSHGRVTVEGRRGDLIISGGENVWPEPIERILERHPAVADVGIAGAPDPEWGATVTAYVVPVDPAAPPALGELRDAVKASLPAFYAPRNVVVVSSLPRTALGKLQRHLLTGGAPTDD